MNEHGQASFNALQKALPYLDENMLICYVFGSQVKSTERLDSDLDVLYLSDEVQRGSHVEKIRNIITTAKNGVKKASVFPYNIKSIKKFVNMYGSLEYNTLRGLNGSIPIFSSPNADAFLETLLEPLDFEKSTQMHIVRIIDEFLPIRTDCSMNSRYTKACLIIDYTLRACLLANHVAFPDTRNLRDLYALLEPDAREMFEFLDFDMINIHMFDETYHLNRNPLSQSIINTVCDMATKSATVACRYVNIRYA